MGMQVDIVVRAVFSVLFIATLLAGAYLFKNFDRLLGTDPQVPTENSGSRGLNRVQVITIWLHALAITGAFAFFG
jgi:hypothetical protein